MELLAECRSATASPEWLQRGVEVTDSNAAFFDAANGFHGCIAGLHEVLRRQGLLDPVPIRRAWHQHVQGRRDLALELWDVLALQAWLDRWMPGQAG